MLEKRTVFIRIQSLKTSIVQLEENAIYETKYNGTISNLKTESFKMQFRNIINNYTNTTEGFFKKTETHDLSLLCNINYYTLLRLNKIEKQIILNDINYKYNFIILPVDNKETIKVHSNRGVSVKLNYPQTLNFTLEESLNISYIMSSPYHSGNIALNPDSDYLTCSDLANIKTCIVPLSHFQGKSSGYYDTYHFFEYNGSLINSSYYESDPFYVILPSDDTITPK